MFVDHNLLCQGDVGETGLPGDTGGKGEKVREEILHAKFFQIFYYYFVQLDRKLLLFFYNKVGLFFYYYSVIVIGNARFPWSCGQPREEWSTGEMAHVVRLPQNAVVASH